MTTKPSMHPLLRELGITPEMIARHVVSVDRRPVVTKCDLKRNSAMRKIRAERRALGLNVTTGLPLQRSPNGTRKVYVRRNVKPEEMER